MSAPATTPQKTEAQIRDEQIALLQGIQQAQQTRQQVTQQMTSHVTDTDLPTYIKEVEKDLLFQIGWNLKNSKISLQEARNLAKDFLALLPLQDKEDVLEKLEYLSVRYPEARSVYVKFVTPVIEQDRDKRLTLISEMIKSGQLEKAIEVAKGGLENG